MSIPIADNPKLTYALIKLEDELSEQLANPHPAFTEVTTHKDEVLTRYQPVFSANHLHKLTREEFDSFLLFRNNHHWTSMNRVGKYITENMDLLREALAILVDETRPIRDRLNELRPERYWGEHSMVSHLGVPMLTAILQVTQPDKYGVWNNTSDEGLRIVRLWDSHWEGKLAGDSYVEMNEVYLFLAKSLQVDLWTLDVLWWMLKK